MFTVTLTDWLTGRDTPTTLTIFFRSVEGIGAHPSDQSSDVGCLVALWVDKRVNKP